MMQVVQSQPTKVQVAGEVYTVRQKLGEGTFGVVYKATKRPNVQRVLVKIRPVRKSIGDYQCYSRSSNVALNQS